MKSKLFLLTFGGFIFFCSCSKDIILCPETCLQQNSEFSISIQEALSSLELFMTEQNLINTKNGLNGFVDNYFSISPSSTKSSGTKGDVLYAVNFKNESGYALLAADSRIKEDILVLSHKGSVQKSDFMEPQPLMISSDTDDLSTTEYNYMVQAGVLADNFNKQINRQCFEYANSQIEETGYSSSSRIDDSDNSGGNSSSCPEVFSWTTIKEVPRMLKTAWTQSTANNDIFNKYCPFVGLSHNIKAPAGCVCIAVSQIIAHNEFPAKLTCNDMRIDYPMIKTIYYYNGQNLVGSGTDTSKEMLARFCSNVGAWCQTKYHAIFGISWGFAWPSGARDCLTQFGYQNVQLHSGYDENQILESLDNGYPVFMAAIAGFISGHAWVIDGYINRDFSSNKGKVLKKQTLVHCNWGWAGDCNGYFTSGIFHTLEGEIYDEGLSTSMNENYWHAYYTITYEVPAE